MAMYEFQHGVCGYQGQIQNVTAEDEHDMMGVEIQVGAKRVENRRTQHGDRECLGRASSGCPRSGPKSGTHSRTVDPDIGWS